MAEQEGRTDILDSEDLGSRSSASPDNSDTQAAASLIDLAVPTFTVLRTQEPAHSTGEDLAERDTAHISYFTGRYHPVSKREVHSPEAQGFNPNSDAEHLPALRPDCIFLAINDHTVLEVERLPSLVDRPDLVRQKAREIVRTTFPLSEERAARLGYLSDRAVDLSELHHRCDEALEAAFRAADDAVWEDLPDSPATAAAESLGQGAADGSAARPSEDPAENLARPSTPPTAQLQENAEIVTIGQAPRDKQADSGEENTAQPRSQTEEPPAAAYGAPKPSYCCYIALVMTARVLGAPAMSGMLEAIRRGADLDDVILNVECFMQPSESQPSEPDTPEKPGYGHVYALLGCLIATAYVKHRYAVDTVYLNRSISNLDVAMLKMPDIPFKEFRDYLQQVRGEVTSLQVLFQRVELEDDPNKDAVLCAICLDLKPIIGYHETDYASHKMDFERVCRNATMRCRVCILLRDATASMYALLGVAWEDITEIRYENRSVGKRWYDRDADDFVAELLWGRDGALQIWISSFYLRGEVKSLSSFELHQLSGMLPLYGVI